MTTGTDTCQCQAAGDRIFQWSQLNSVRYAYLRYSQFQRSVCGNYIILFFSRDYRFGTLLQRQRSTSRALERNY